MVSYRQRKSVEYCGVRMTKFILRLAIVAICSSVFTGCISFQGDAVTALPADQHSLDDLKANPVSNRSRPLTAKEISDRILDAEKRRKFQTESGTIFTFQRNVVIDEIKGKTKKYKTRTYQSFSDHRDPVLMLVNGKPPTPDEVEKDRKEIHKHQIRIMGQDELKGDSNHKGDSNLMVRNIEKHRDKFIPRLIGTEIVNGRLAYILQLLPDPTKKFKDVLVNEAVKHMIIKFWVDQRDFQVAKSKIVLAHPMFVIGGLAATVKTFEATAYQKRLTKDIWVDHRVTAKIEGRVLWNPRVIRFSSESTNFELLPKQTKP